MLKHLAASQKGHDHADQSEWHVNESDDSSTDASLTESRRDTRKLAGAMLLGSFLVRDAGAIDLEETSAYGAAILLPQLGRSLSWPRFIVWLCIRSYIFLFLSMGIQFSLLRLISKEESVLDLFSGQMYLCDFSGGERGPGGTDVAPSRMYPFDIWITRSFVKDSLKAVFPQLKDQIESSVDVGEYALESFPARRVCCFIFVMAMLSEMLLIGKMMQLFWHVPSEAESWINLQDPDKKEGTWLDRVDIRIAGIPRVWKIFYIATVLIPKMLIWKLTSQTGVTFLMETASIEDLIINSMAMAFILNIDEMICGIMMSEAERVMLKMCADYPLYDVHEEARLSNGQILERYHVRQGWSYLRPRDLYHFLPMKLIINLALLWILMWDYYQRHCDQDSTGRYVSKAVYTPTNSDFSFFRTILPNFFDGQYDKDPFWTWKEA